MFCPKCGGIPNVIKVHEQENTNKPRLCDVQCLKCSHIMYYQPYDYGSTIRLVPSLNDNKKSQ